MALRLQDSSQIIRPESRTDTRIKSHNLKSSAASAECVAHHRCHALAAGRTVAAASAPAVAVAAADSFRNNALILEKVTCDV